MLKYYRDNINQFRGATMDFYFIIWSALFLIAVFFELLSPGFFFFLSFACGCVVAACLNFFAFSMSVQLTTFAITSLIALILLKNFVSQSLKGHAHPTNMDALIGKKGTVIKDIEPNNGGHVKVNGEIWFGKSINNDAIKTGSVIEVLGVKGSHVVVKKLHD